MDKVLWELQGKRLTKFEMPRKVTRELELREVYVLAGKAGSEVGIAQVQASRLRTSRLCWRQKCQVLLGLMKWKVRLVWPQGPTVRGHFRSEPFILSPDMRLRSLYASRTW